MGGERIGRNMGTMYNMLFGQNPLSDVLFATLGLTKQDVGRFRDCFIAGGKIAVYTRNGGGNRECWHKYNPELGNEHCKHHVIEKEVEEKFMVDKEKIGQYPHHYHIYCGGQQIVGTGKQIMKPYYVCDAPNSKECACPGCIITYRLPEHPNYLYDEDDDFDCTYATIYFSFPDEYADALRKLDDQQPFDPDQKWLDLIASLGTETE